MANAKPNACCDIDGNLEVVESVGKVSGVVRGMAVTGDKIIKKCKVCGARHHELSLDPIEISHKG